MTCSSKIRLRKTTLITDIYAAFNLGQKTIRVVLKRQDDKVIRELKIKKQANNELKFLNGTSANLAVESGYKSKYLVLLISNTFNTSDNIGFF